MLNAQNKINIGKKNHRSIRSFLTLSLLCIITISAIVLGILNYFQIRKQNESVFQIQMINSAKTIDVLLSSVINLKYIQSESYESKLKKYLSVLSSLNTLTQEYANKPTPYNANIAFQIYSDNGKLLLNTGDIPPFFSKDFNLENSSIIKEKNEFSGAPIYHIYIKGLSWYVFSMQSRYQPYKIVVLVHDSYQYDVFISMFISSLINMCIIYLFIIIACTVLVFIALLPLNQIKTLISKRNPRQLEPINIKKIPLEVKPVIDELNKLFNQITDVVDREKRFSADAAHEMKTPIAGLRTQAELALYLDDKDEIKDKIKIIIESAERYSDIIDQLLILNRLSPQQELPDQDYFNLNNIAEQQIGDLVIKAMDKNIIIGLDESDIKPMFHGSGTLMGILTRNLIYNSIIYCPNNSKIDISIAVKNNIIEMIISDNGYGVPKEKLERIFDRFYRQEGNNQKGSGLGLSIVKEIVRLHNGTISAQNNTPKGLKIIINIPLVY